MKYTRDAFGSRLEISILGDTKNNDSGISESFSYVEDFEQKYSRFIENNILHKINLQKQTIIEKELVSLISLCQKVSRLTHGHFDITSLITLENQGYGISQEEMVNVSGYKNIQLEGENICLNNGVQIEFGSCGKGYMLDVIYNTLCKYHAEFIINFGGDMRVTGSKKILLEDPLDTTKNIGNIVLNNMSIASSSGNRRKIGEAHHLIDMNSGLSQDDKIAVYVTHKLGVFADIFATALFVTPLELSLKVLEQVDGLEALIISSQGKIYKSQNFIAKLTI